MASDSVYMYQAALWCEDCGKAIQQDLIAAGKAPPEDPDYEGYDENSYDSDDFPKGPFPDGGGESDSPAHCDAMDGCLNAIKLKDGHKVGAWLENPLTTAGAKYVCESVHEKPDNEVTKLWAEWYRDDLSAIDCFKGEEDEE